MAMPNIDEILPGSRSGLDREALAELYGRPGAARGAGPWIRVNFVATADGSATGDDDRSGTISSEADMAVFGVLRRLADVVLVAAGTVRREGYEGPLVREAQRAWRLEHGLAEHPGFAIVSERLDLDPDSALFAESPVRPLVLTYASSPADRHAALAEVADIAFVGEDALDRAALRDAFAERGWSDVLCEGGPTFFGSLAHADAVDELCLTVVPKLVAGDGPRIAHGRETDVALRLAHVLHGPADELILRYTR
ncbi:MAG TPA: pyrimidine reductase family protein [Microbacteriaceae bacterium]|nr:pyrimidine reductase family protein [Microbacteriaceae bacterium]